MSKCVSDIGRNTLVVIKSVETAGFQDGQVYTNDYANKALISATSLVGPSANPTSIPPLGTVNYDGIVTSENDQTQTAGGGDFLANQPFAGAFQYLYGKTAINLNEDIEKIEVNDVSSIAIAKKLVRGMEAYSGTLEMWKEDADNRWNGAVMGLWDPIMKRYTDGACYRQYEIWVLIGPDRMDTRATSANTLIKMKGVIFDKIDIGLNENPIKYSIPFTCVRVEELIDWSDETDVDNKGVSVEWDDDLAVTCKFRGVEGQSLLGSAQFGEGTFAPGYTFTEIEGGVPVTTEFPLGVEQYGSSSVHTRLLVDFFNGDYETEDAVNGLPYTTTATFAGLTASRLDSDDEMTITIRGIDPFGKEVTETYYWALFKTYLTALEAAGKRLTLLTSTYFGPGPITITINSASDITAGDAFVMNVYDVDYKIQYTIPEVVLPEANLFPP